MFIIIPLIINEIFKISFHFGLLVFYRINCSKFFSVGLLGLKYYDFIFGLVLSNNLQVVFNILFLNKKGGLLWLIALLIYICVSFKR